MMGVEHQRIVKFLGAGEMHDDSTHIDTLFTVQEFMAGGSLDTRLWGEPLQSVTWLERLTWACDVAEGMAHIHMRGFAHRDLKSQNILCDAVTGRAKVGDFGLARSINAARDAVVSEGESKDLNHSSLRSSDGKSPRNRGSEEQGMKRVGSHHDLQVMTAVCGTVPYMAPELCGHEVAIEDKWKKAAGPVGTKSSARRFTLNGAVKYGMMVDVYAYAITLHEMTTHERPWAGNTKIEIFRSVLKGDRPAYPEEQWDGGAGCPQGWLSLIKKCWDQEPAARPPFDEILRRLSMSLSDQLSQRAAQRELASTYPDREEDVEQPGVLRRLLLRRGGGGVEGEAGGHLYARSFAGEIFRDVPTTQTEPGAEPLLTPESPSRPRARSSGSLADAYRMSASVEDAFSANPSREALRVAARMGMH